MGTSPALHPRDLRLRLDLPAQLQLGSQDPAPVHVIDLSAKGAFVETDLVASSGTAAVLVLDADADADAGGLTLDGVVMRAGSSLRDAVHPDLDALVVRAHGLGLRFVSLSTGVRGKLGELLTRIREGR